MKTITITILVLLALAAISRAQSQRFYITDISNIGAYQFAYLVRDHLNSEVDAKCVLVIESHPNVSTGAVSLTSQLIPCKNKVSE